MGTLQPLIPTGEQTGRFLYGLLRRALKSATRADLEGVVRQCASFTHGLEERGLLIYDGELIATEASHFLSTADRAEIQGPSTADRTDQEWEEHLGQVPDNELLADDEPAEVGLREAEGTGGGHETQVAGDGDDQWEVDLPPLQEDGAG